MYFATRNGTLVFTNSLPSISSTRSPKGSLPVLQSAIYFEAEVGGATACRSFPPESSAEVSDSFSLILRHSHSFFHRFPEDVKYWASQSASASRCFISYSFSLTTRNIIMRWLSFCSYLESFSLVERLWANRLFGEFVHIAIASLLHSEQKACMSTSVYSSLSVRSVTAEFFRLLVKTVFIRWICLFRKLSWSCLLLSVSASGAIWLLLPAFCVVFLATSSTTDVDSARFVSMSGRFSELCYKSSRSSAWTGWQLFCFRAEIGPREQPRWTIACSWYLLMVVRFKHLDTFDWPVVTGLYCFLQSHRCGCASQITFARSFWARLVTTGWSPICSKVEFAQAFSSILQGLCWRAAQLYFQDIFFKHSKIFLLNLILAVNQKKQ